jgi:hypothetical protein
VLDQHLFHESLGRGTHRQWRVDYICNPVRAEAENQSKAYLREFYRPDWDGGFDVDRYPTYGLIGEARSVRPSRVSKRSGVSELAPEH